MPSQRQENGIALCETGSIAYTIFRSAKRKRTISFLFESETRLRIVAPLKVSHRTIASLLEKRASWISQKLRDFQSHPQPMRKQLFHDGGRFHYLGHHYSYHLTHNIQEPQGSFLRPHFFQINLPQISLNDSDKNEEIRIESLLWLKRRARKKFAQRLKIWSDYLGVHYRKILITDTRSRWGSCNYKNVIRLNWRLIMMPLAIIDYVVVHELAHTVHKNHSPQFWDFVRKAMPDYQERQHKLQKISRQFML